MPILRLYTNKGEFSALGNHRNPPRHLAMIRVLNIAEKNSVAKAIAEALGGGPGVNKVPVGKATPPARENP